MNDPDELCRHVRSAQHKAEKAGFVRTAAALATVAEMLLQGAQVDAAVILGLRDAGVGQPVGELRLVRQTWH